MSAAVIPIGDGRWSMREGPVPCGKVRSGSPGAKTPTTGMPNEAATWSGPESAREGRPARGEWRGVEPVAERAGRDAEWREEARELGEHGPVLVLGRERVREPSPVATALEADTNRNARGGDGGGGAPGR